MQAGVTVSPVEYVLTPETNRLRWFLARVFRVGDQHAQREILRAYSRKGVELHSLLGQVLVHILAQHMISARS